MEPICYVYYRYIIMKKPLIGITLDSEKKETYSKFPWYALRENYLSSISNLNAIPIPLVHDSKLIKNFGKLLDGLILTGGNFDIDPKIYNHKKKGTRKINKKRTNFEIKIYNKFLELNKPILGICGGAQLINIASGGTLIQDISKTPINHEQINPRNETSHKINIFKRTKLFEICKKNTIRVNSAHHQAIKTLGKDIKISATSNDGIIEGIEHKKHKWCIGLQWHPEFLITNEDLKIFKNFINTI